MGGVGLTVIIMQVSVQIGLNWYWTGTELGNICSGGICTLSGISQLLLTQFGLNFKDNVKAKSMQG